MAIKLKRQASGSVAVPPASHIAFFIDQNGNPALMDGNGDVRPAVSVDGSPLSLDEQETAPAPEAGTVKLYAKDVDGVSQPFFRSDDGTEGQIGAAGSGTYYDDSQSASIVAELLPQAGTYSWNTGIIPNLVANTSLVMHIETQTCVPENSWLDFGFLRLAFLWATAPTIPGSLLPLLWGDLNSNGYFEALGNQLSDISLNASGELVLDFNDTKGNDSYLTLKITVAPVVELPVAPNFPPPIP